jgi:GntR family transcriptional regulator / MocR family aminotransferase
MPKWLDIRIDGAPLAMMRTKSGSSRCVLIPDPTVPGLSRRLTVSLRQALLSGQFPAGSRLPSTRVLASELAVSRNTVMEAYAQLLAEGYLEGRTGSGTFVSRALPEEFLHRPTGITAADLGPRSATLSDRGTRIANAYKMGSGDALRAFNPGFPQLDPALFTTWWRLAARRGRCASRETLSYGDPAGYRPLREAIASHIGTARGVRCTADQVIVTSGSQYGVALICRMLTEPGDLAWMEDPGYNGARAAITSAAARIVPVPVDDEGIDVEFGVRHAPAARLVYVSPSHQYPLGVTMSLARRLRLLEWASRSGAWVIEDDYDSEFRHGERPLPTLQSLDTFGCVLYVGTFSKVLFPALRLGYIVVPQDMVDPFRQAQLVLGCRASTSDQATLADFIVEGQFTRHVRRMRTLYEDLRSVLGEAIRRRIGSALTLTGAAVGLHVLGRLADGFDDRVVSRCAMNANVDAPPLSNYYVGPPTMGALVLGYGQLDRRSIRSGVDGLVSALRESQCERSLQTTALT